MAPPRQVVATRLFDFVPVLAGRNLITWTVGAWFDPVLLALDRTPDYRRTAEHGGFAKKRADNPNHFRVHHRVDGDWLYVDLPQTAENYYTDFPLVKLVDCKLAGSWVVPIKGSHAFAVDGERVLFAGSYKERDHLFLGALGTTKFQ